MKKILSTSVQFFLTAWVLIGLMQANGLLAQSGTILGVVQDESKGVLPGVSVTATNLETNHSQTAISDDEGQYRVAQLPSGTYEVRAGLEGFTTEVRRPITLRVDSQAVVDFSLTVGQIEEIVVVTGEAPLVETSSAVTSGLVDDRQIRDLPLNGRDFVQLALLQEGVVTSTKFLNPQAGNEGSALSFAGARIHQNAFLLDGTDIRGARGVVPAGATGGVVGVETVKEFKVITGAFSAEYGQFSGGVITAVTKSGTNDVHGSVFWYHRNSALDARNFFDRNPLNPLQRSDVPEFKRNQFGFSLGGPVVRDKTFFFGSIEVLRERELLTQLTSVLSDEAREGRLLGFFPFPPPGRFRPIAVNPDVQPFIDMIPRANGEDLGGGIAEHLSEENFPRNSETFTLRVDHEFSEADSFFARYTLDQSDRQFFWSHQSDLMNEYRYQYLTLSEKHVFSPNVINEVRVGFTRSLSNQIPVESLFDGSAVDPSLRVSRQEPPFGPVLAQWLGTPIDRFGAFLGAKQVPNRFSYSDDISWTRGSHFLKIGAAYTRMQTNGKSTTGANGLYIMPSVQLILQARPVRFNTFGRDVTDVGMRQNLFGFYIQDDWKMTPRLTVNLGLRYEFITSPTEVGTGEYIGRPDIKGRIANLVDRDDPVQHLGNPLFENPSELAFSPRIGFAWDVFGNSKTSLRGGFGLFYDQLTNYLYSTGGGNPPFDERLTQGANFGAGVFPLLAPKDPYPFLDADAPSTINMGAPKQPYLMQFSLNLQQEVLPNTVLTVGYMGALGRKLPRMVQDINMAIPVKYDASQYPNGPGPEFNGHTYFPFCSAYNPGGICPSSNVIALPKRNPNFATIRMQLWDGNSSYNALRLRLDRRFSSDLALQLSYSYSRAIDESSNVGHSDANAGNEENSSWQVIDPDDKGTMRGLSSNHIAQTFSGNFTYALPFNPQGMAGLFLGGWQINGIVTASTGPPSSFSMDSDRAHSEQDTESQRPTLAAGFSNNPVLHDGREPDEYFDLNALEVPTEGFFGNLGRNTLILPGVLTFDFGVTKNFTLHEGVSLQFKSEIFNAFNRANFDIPNMNIFGGSAANPVLNPGAGRITQTTGTSRQIQFALKIVF